MVQPRQDITRVTLAVLFIGGLLVSSAWVMLPFLPAIVWALTLVIATWPLMIWVERRAGNRRGVAVLVMTLVLLSVLIVPFWLAVNMVVDNVDDIKGLIRSALTLGHVDKVSSQITRGMIQDCFLGGGFGAWRPDG
jgi:predicted PurR-regulated permease PerM